MQQILSVIITALLVLACVSLHYETLRILNILLQNPRRWLSGRLLAGTLVIGCLMAHSLEVVLFGIGFRVLEFMHQGADLQGSHDGFYCTYYSVVVYTSLGFGDVVPITRAMRVMTAVEGLMGAILIAWTASFMYYHMQRFWDLDHERMGMRGRSVRQLIHRHGGDAPE
ncbi:MAG: potassium channel family protein [Rubripirellula sp.]